MPTQTLPRPSTLRQRFNPNPAPAALQTSTPSPVPSVVTRPAPSAPVARPQAPAVRAPSTQPPVTIPVAQQPTTIISPPPSAPSAVKSARPKISLGFGKKTPAKEDKYPALTDEEIVAIATRIKEQSVELEALAAAIDADKASLKRLARSRYFALHTGKAKVPSSISIPTTAGDILVSFTSRYSKLESADPIAQTFGEDFVEEHFVQAFKVTIDGAQLPTVDPSQPDRCPAQEFIDRLTELVSEFGVEDAVSQSEEMKPTREFHDKRHLLLTPEQNEQFDDLCPMVTAVKTKGRDEAANHTRNS